MSTLISRLSRAAAFSLFTFVGTLAHAGTNYWSAVGSIGGQLSDMKFDRDDASRVIASAPEAVIWSNDGGDTWNEVYFEGKLVAPQAVAAGRSRFYIYTTSSQLLSSQDGGRTWIGTTPPITLLGGLEVDPQDSRVIYSTVAEGTNQLGTRAVVVKSQDAGTTWTKLAPVGGQGTVYQMLVDPVRSGILHVGILNERFLFSYDYYKSTDGGASWTSLTPALPGGAVPRMAIDTSHPDTLYVTRLADGRKVIYIARSTDGGATWQVNATNLPSNGGDAYFVVTDAVDYGTLYSGGLAVVYRSTDFGLTWSEIKTPSADNAFNSMKVIADPTRSKRLFILPRDGTYRTDDAAAWTEVKAGINARSVRIHVDEPRLVARTPSGLNLPILDYVSVDRAEWNLVSAQDVPFAPEFANPPWTAVRYAIVPITPNARSEGGSFQSSLYRSGDDGQTWTKSTLTGVEVPDRLFAVSDTGAGSPAIMLGAYDVQNCEGFCRFLRRQLVVSTDGGLNWKRTGVAPSGIPMSAAISPNGGNGAATTIVVALDSGIARSTNGGASFESISAQPVWGQLYADPYQSNVLYSATGVNGLIPILTGPGLPPALYRSGDGGFTWAAAALGVTLTAATGAVSDLAFSAVMPGRIDVVVQDGKLGRSDDGGANWSLLSLGAGEGVGLAQFGRHEPRNAYLSLYDQVHGVKSYTIDRDRSVDVVEFYNSMLNHYFLTLNAEEALGIDRGAAGPGWIRTGVAFRAWLSAAVAPFDARPVCRFYGTPGRGPNSHFYTANAGECAAVKSDPGWTYEGIGFYVLAPQNDQCPGSVAVYRAYNNGLLNNDSNHRYSTQLSLLQAMTAQGWSVEGVAFCGAAN